MRAKWISENPFDGLPTSFRRNTERDHYIPPEIVVDCIKVAPNWEWRTIIALAGFAGLRTPSEILSLRWENVHFERGSIGEMLVTFPKTEHHPGMQSHQFDINDIAAWWGHSVEVALKHYSRRRDEHAQNALRQLKAKTAHATGTAQPRTELHRGETVCRDVSKPRETRKSSSEKWAILDSNQ